MAGGGMLYVFKFAPIYKVRPWGGRRLAELFGRKLPDGQAVGESWELSQMGREVSVVVDGPLAGASLSRLVRMFGADLTGAVWRSGWRFPLLVKWLDADSPLSIQVHPKDGTSHGRVGGGPKTEAWYVIDARPHSRLWCGFKNGTALPQVRRAGGTERIADLLRSYRPRPRQCYFIPPGTVHCLGPDVVVAEIQTPCDTTYRLYDWGSRRRLHVQQALRSLELAPGGGGDGRWPSPPAGLVADAPEDVSAAGPGPRSLLRCADFAIQELAVPPGRVHRLRPGEMSVLMVVAGAGDVAAAAHVARFVAGDTMLVPAAVEAEIVARAQSLLLRITASPVRQGP